MPNTRKVQLGILGLLIIGFIFTVSSALAYWRDVTVSNTVDVIVVRDEAELIVEDMNDELEDKQLVPRGYQVFAGDVESVEFSYDVGISRELINSVNLHVSVKDITIGGDASYGHLIDIDILGQGANAVTDLFNDTVNVTATVSLIEPIDAAEANEKDLPEDTVNVEDSKGAYESIKGQTVEFTLEFSLSTKEESNNEN
ncbi:MAG: hypothetical protein ACLFUQ_06375 [Candidatus Izemoplasmataceae bacterium]